jgi:hypothetical protein
MAASCGTDVEGYVTTEGPVLSAFALEGDSVYHTYFTRDVDFMVGFEQLLARAPRGAPEGVPTRHRRIELRCSIRRLRLRSEA